MHNLSIALSNYNRVILLVI